MSMKKSAVQDTVARTRRSEPLPPARDGAGQEEAMGGQILFNGEETANIIAFIHDDKE